MKLLIITFFALLGFSSIINYSYAQNSIQHKMLSLDHIDDLQLYFQDYYKPGEDYVTNACVKCAVFIKFSVTANGRVDSINISKNAPLAIKEALKKTIMATNGFWKKSKSNKTLLLPVLCLYQSGCTPGVLDSVPKKTLNLKEVFKSDFVNGEFITSVTDLLKFESQTFNTLNCILIRPFTVGTMH